MKFTDKLDHLMKKNGLNKRTFALKCDIPYTTVCGWYDRGYDGVRMSTIRKISEAFDTSLEYWAYDEPDETEKSPAPEGTGEKEFILLDETNDLLVELGYIQKGPQLSDADLAFLEHWIGLLDAWFRRE